MAKRKRKSRKQLGSPAQRAQRKAMAKASTSCKGLPGEEFRSCVAEELTGSGLGQARRRRRRRY